MKKSFLRHGSPFVTEMIQVKTAEQAKSRIRRAIVGGATAIGLQLNTMEEGQKTDKILQDLFAETKDLPLYVTNYRTGENEGKSDEILAEELLRAVDLGATAVDVMGDLFDPSVEELATSEKAMEKQTRWIEEIHRRGGEALMSSHVNSFRKAERVLEIAKAQESRGADIVKIVTGAQTQEEEIENLSICRLLSKELNVPFLFLSGGEFSKLHRNIGPALGVFSWLCFSEYDEFTYPGPPLLKDVLAIKRALHL